ncbi:striated muscle-specific serine threonine-kinase-like isoform X2 [Pelobates cultripes]|uniref:Striated muscle-specific serine threonine-kinase-like isoform X2 n=1 Tax=Pelobates cultripes TaxID=61616 RepID=A0AAD1WGE4_PELCU|nr:striated muscle-specific serine threonine-kinase-like isoform X2 [Pelobates cultripes]
MEGSCCLPVCTAPPSIPRHEEELDEETVSEIRTLSEGLRTIYSCEVFRSCRKHSYDSEPGEEDAGGPQLQRTIRAPNNTPLGTPSGDSDTLLASSLHTTPSTLTGLSHTDELSDWSGSQQTVVERDLRSSSFLPEGGLRRGSINGSIPDSPQPHLNQKPPILPPPSPRLGQRPAAIVIPGRGPSTPLTPRKKTVMPSQYQDTVSEEFEEKVKRPKSSAGSQVSGQDSRPVTPVSDTSGRVSILRASPKLVRSGSKIFERLRTVEERRKSLDQTDSPFLVQSWLPIRKARSFDQPGADGLAGSLASSSEELRDDLRDGVRSEVGGYTLRYPSLRHKTASLDDRGAFSGRLSDIESRFSQELLRIKKTVSQQQLLRSSQDLSRRSPSPQRSLTVQQVTKDPMPTQVSPATKTLTVEDKKPATLVTTRKPLVRSSATANQVADVPERQKFTSQPAPFKEKPSNGSAVHHDILKQTETRFTSQPLTDRIITPKPVTLHMLPQKENISALHVKKSPEPGRELTHTSTQAPPALEIAHRGIGHTKGPLAVETRFLPWAQPPVDNEKNQGKGGGQTKKHSDAKSSKNSRSKGKSRRNRPMSPELESSDDSYVSAGEDPLEAPVFDIPLQSALVNAGAEVLLKCVISANPSPEVSWRKDRILLKNSPTHQIRTEGERHTLLLRWALPSDSGIYTVTARNEVGEASSCGALTVRPAPSKESPATRGTPRDLLSPITSDDEYLSPQEDLSEPTTPQHKMAGKAPTQHTVTFKAPPSFKVALQDKWILEGQDVTLSVQVLGEPKPIINW